MYIPYPTIQRIVASHTLACLCHRLGAETCTKTVVPRLTLLLASGLTPQTATFHSQPPSWTQARRNSL